MFLMFHTYIDFFIIVSLTQVMQYGSLIEMSQVGHVFDFLEFRWIGRWQLVTFEDFLLLVCSCVWKNGGYRDRFLCESFNVNLLLNSSLSIFS